MNKKNKNESSKETLMKYICAECGNNNIDTIIDDYTFPYGLGEETVDLVCKVPIRTCKNCGYKFMDEEAENICHEAICKHLHVMTPSQIKSLREFYKLSQNQFAKITGLGEATLSRWERGVIIQNGAYDNYLYLLGYDQNLERLIKRQSGESIISKMKNEDLKEKFLELEVTEELLQKQNRFELQPI